MLCKAETSTGTRQLEERAVPLKAQSPALGLPSRPPLPPDGPAPTSEPETLPKTGQIAVASSYLWTCRSTCIFTGGGGGGWGGVNPSNLMIYSGSGALRNEGKKPLFFKHVLRGSSQSCCWLPVLCNYLRPSVQETWFSVSVIRSLLCGRSSSPF